jgi:hypothetical protein
MISPTKRAPFPLAPCFQWAICAPAKWPPKCQRDTPPNKACWSPSQKRKCAATASGRTCSTHSLRTPTEDQPAWESTSCRPREQGIEAAIRHGVSLASSARKDRWYTNATSNSMRQHSSPGIKQMPRSEIQEHLGATQQLRSRSCVQLTTHLWSPTPTHCTCP